MTSDSALAAPVVEGIMLTAAALMSAFVLYEKIVHAIWVHNNPLFIIAVTSALMGVQSIGTGILAELIVRTSFESQHKATYAIAGRVGFPQDVPGAR